MFPCDLWVQDRFPNLRNGGYRVTSKDTEDYNCIAWAAGETDRKWGHPGAPYYFWPDGIPNNQSVDAYKAAYATCGFVECADAVLEAGYVRIAIYAHGNDVQHAARQLSNGEWTSKLGDGWDIEHVDLNGVESAIYGQPVAFMKRLRTEEDEKIEKTNFTCTGNC